MIKFYNVLTRKKEKFIPIDKDNVKMYACGITVSGDAHLGHVKQAIQFDVIRKYLEYKGYKVNYVRNHTDVDDKIIARANKENVYALDLANKYINRINKDFAELGIGSANIEPKASETMQDIIEFVEALIKKGFAYATKEGSVFFEVSKFKKYGKLSGRSLEEGLAGEEVKGAENKKNEEDFCLWKTAKPEEISWDSPWGKGRPGWHIECSAMCYKFLGKTIDIHGGGRDLIFPHHENEIAQSEARFNQTFSNYWIHCGLLKINGTKMSKSLGNGITARQILESYEPEVAKMIILQTNYRKDLNILDGDYSDAEKHLYAFYKNLKSLNESSKTYPKNIESEFAKEIKTNFEKAMDDDFNSAIAIANLFNINATISKQLIKKDQSILYGVQEVLLKCYAVLGLLQEEPIRMINSIKTKYIKKLNIDSIEIEKLIKELIEAKKVKDYTLADSIKAKLTLKGIKVQENINGINWDIEISK